MFGVSCCLHGIVVAWRARRSGRGVYYSFDDAVAWLTARGPKTVVREMTRVAWRMSAVLRDCGQGELDQQRSTRSLWS